MRCSLPQDRVCVNQLLIMRSRDPRSAASWDLRSESPCPAPAAGESQSGSALRGVNTWGPRSHLQAPSCNPQCEEINVAGETNVYGIYLSPLSVKRVWEPYENSINCHIDNVQLYSIFTKRMKNRENSVFSEIFYWQHRERILFLFHSQIKNSKFSGLCSESWW